MENLHIENPYNPYPVDLRGQFCEIPEHDKARFFEINSIKYDPKEIERLRNNGILDQSILGQFIKLINDDNLESIYFIYKLQTYIADPSLKDAWEFNKSIIDYKEFGFTSFNDLLNLCKERWGIDKKNFVPIHETNIAS